MPDSLFAHLASQPGSRLDQAGPEIGGSMNGSPQGSESPPTYENVTVYLLGMSEDERAKSEQYFFEHQDGKSLVVIIIQMLEHQFISEPCSWFHTLDNFQATLQMKNYSGIGINRLGIYTECVNNPSFKYFLFQYHSALDHPPDDIQQFYTGICYSANCTENDLYYLSEALNSYIPKPYSHLIITEVSQQAISFSQHPFTIILLAILALYFALCLIFTFIWAFRRLKKVASRKFLEVFSYVHSFQLLVRRTSSTERLKIMVGLRACSLVCMTVYNIGSILTQTPSPQISQLLSIFYYSFDIWLLVSGFYLAFDLSRSWHRIQSSKLIFFYLLRKALKVFFTIVIVCLMVRFLLLPTGSGPIWKLFYHYYTHQCPFNALQFLLLSNLSGIGCDNFLWLWQAEVQMAILGCCMFFLIKANYRFSLHSVLALQLLILGSGFLGVTWLGRDSIDYDTGLLQGMASKWPTTRAMPYLVGFNMGYWYFEFRVTRKKEELRSIKIFQYPIIRILVPLMGACLIAFSYVFCYSWLPDMLHTAHSQVQINYCVQALHLLIAVGVGLVVITSMLGFKGPIYAFLHDRFLSYISKVSFSSYAMQYISVAIVTSSRTEDIYLNLAKIISYCACALFISLVGGSLFCVVFEMPLHKLLALSLKGDGNKYIEFQ